MNSLFIILFLSFDICYIDSLLTLSCFYIYCDSLHRSLHSSYTLLYLSCTAMWLLLLCALFSLSLSVAWRDPGFCINRPVRVSACYYNNMLFISCAFSPSLVSIPSLFLCSDRTMRPPLWERLNFDFSLLLLVTGDVSLNPNPSVHGLHLGTVNACSMRYKVPALSDLATSKAIDLLGITETWLTTRETSTDLAEMTSQGRVRWRGVGVGLLVSSAHTFSVISLPTQTSFEAIW